MHFHVFDHYQEQSSIIHRLNPRVKVLAAVGFILSNALLPDGAWAAFLLSWLFLLGVNRLSNLGLAYSIRRSAIVLPFVLIAITVLFSVPGNPLLSLSVFMREVTITDMGLLRFVSILIRSWLSIQMAIVLVAVTRFPDLIHALQHLRIPAILTTIIAFLYRYLFVLSDEVLRLLRARDSRSAVVQGARSGGSVVWRARVAGNMTGQLFLRSFERSDRIYNAMIARGYSGNQYTLNPHEMKSSDYFTAAFVLTSLFLLQVIGRF